MIRYKGDSLQIYLLYFCDFHMQYLQILISHLILEDNFSVIRTFPHHITGCKFQHPVSISQLHEVLFFFFLSETKKNILKEEKIQKKEEIQEKEKKQEKDERSFPQKQKLNKRENTQLQKTKYKGKPQLTCLSFYSIFHHA